MEGRGIAAARRTRNMQSGLRIKPLSHPFSLSRVSWVTVLIMVITWSFSCPPTAFAQETPQAVSNSENSADASSLFAPEPNVQVLGPTRFPKPTDLLLHHQQHNGDDDDDDVEAVVLLEPTFGQHRRHQDAVFAYAEGYELPRYMMFVDSLRSTGFGGDVVLAVAALPLLEPGVEDYLRSHPNVVVYAMNFLNCSSDHFETTAPRKNDKGGMMSFQMCKLPGVYGYRDAQGTVRPAADPREGRVVATSRYELYWIWSLQYDTHQWLMLLDARDAYFQTNPFAGLPRSLSSDKDGLLYFFGENANATRLGKSPKNRKWLERGYGLEVQQMLADKPTICSGSTMGEQVALEEYLRALVNEWDETHVHQKGADQGFHNYLYYTNKLANANAIRSITVFEQGKGIINNLGALRDKPLTDWGALRKDTWQVVNWDGTPSPVVHQWDRDKDLFDRFERKQFRQMQKEWNLKQAGKKALH